MNSSSENDANDSNLKPKQLNFQESLDADGRPTSCIVQRDEYFPKLAELRASGARIESVSTVPGHNASWRIQWFYPKTKTLDMNLGF